MVVHDVRGIGLWVNPYWVLADDECYVAIDPHFINSSHVSIPVASTVALRLVLGIPFLLDYSITPYINPLPLHIWCARMIGKRPPPMHARRLR